MAQTKTAELAPKQRLFLHYFIVVLVSLVFILVVDAVTLDVINHSDYPLPDHHTYLSMVENGIIDNPNLTAPFVYRFGFTAIASLIMQVSGLSVYAAFKLIMYLSLVTQSMLVYALIRTVTPDFRIGMSILAILGFAFFNFRYLVFDPIRPEPITYCLLLLSFLLIYHKRLILAALVAIVGLSIREFMIAPLASIVILYALDFYKTKDWRLLLKIIVIGGLSAWMIIPPRLLISYSDNHAYLNSWDDLLFSWFEILRIMNIFIAFTGQMLPIILLMTKERWQSLRQASTEIILPLIPYSIIILLLTVYGGTDLGRFISYLFIPQVIILAIMLKDDFKLWEIGYIVGVWFVYFRFWQDIPMERSAYLDFVGPYYNNITVFAVIRILMLAIAMIGMEYLRRYMNSKSSKKSPP